MIRAFSERLMPPFSGQVQIAESQTYRALTIDAQVWEIQYVKRSHVRVATLKASDIKSRAVKAEILQQEQIDEQLIELLDFLADAQLPFPSTDRFECWLLDAKDETPLALIYSCSDPAQMKKFPSNPDWSALPAAVMPVDKTDEEIKNQATPVNYRLERLVAERAGSRHRAVWLNREEHSSEDFPPLMIREDWPDEAQQSIWQRYIQRQSPRLLMLHGLDQKDRQRLESYCQSYAMEVARFCSLYPQILDDESIRALQVEARLRAATDSGQQSSVQGRRDGILYM